MWLLPASLAVAAAGTDPLAVRTAGRVRQSHSLLPGPFVAAAAALSGVRADPSPLNGAELSDPGLKSHKAAAATSNGALRRAGAVEVQSRYAQHNGTPDSNPPTDSGETRDQRCPGRIPDA